MFVFPANNEEYRKRKRTHKACEQCKRRRKRCEPPLKNHERCAPCMKDNISCSLELFAESSNVNDKPIDLNSSPSRNERDDSTKAITDRLVQSVRVALSNSAAAKRSELGTVNATSSSMLQKSKSSQDASFLSSNTSHSAASAAATAADAVAPMASSTAATLGDAAEENESITSPVNDDSSATAGSSHAISSYATEDIDSGGFIGDLDPASVLLTLRNVEKDRMGVWVKGASVLQPVNSHLFAYLNSIHAFDLPSRQIREALLDVYFTYIHPLLPLLDKEVFLGQHSRDECPTLLLHAVLLAASRHASALKFVPLRSPRHFSTLTAAKIRALLYTAIERDKLTVVRVLALLSLHSEGSDGLEKSCSDLEQAFHYAHFLGLHHERRSHPDQAPMRRLWWCLWCLDRMSACVSARPIISRLDDVGVTGLRPSEEGWLGSFYGVCQILDRVIAMYRPLGSTLPPEVDLEVSYGPDDSSSPFASFLELLRHIACILAHKRAPESPDANASILLRSTERILNIVRTQPKLPPFPAVPYAVSLTLTVYLRLYPSPEARKGWHESCAVLDDLAKTWWVAEAMGNMARSVFKKLEEDFANRTNAEEKSIKKNGYFSPGISSLSKVFKKTKTDNGSSPSISSLLLKDPSPTNADSSNSMLPNNGLADSSRKNINNNNADANTNLNVPNLETQFLEMFSDLPNPTSFLDSALMVDSFNDLIPDMWVPDLNFQEETNADGSSLTKNGGGRDALWNHENGSQPSDFHIKDGQIVIDGFQTTTSEESQKFNIPEPRGGGTGMFNF
ncbi:fungal-specific transcription factor domain-containing protein [Lipomyces japonicus]|uniref:fungal-specific transcription factor domain-containing protein n=1 Tax=Lipomyces japonicus TaxID=56871 RepID=UPI0034CF9225